MTIGIYCIQNKINGKRYIGQSINVERRFREHKTDCGNMHLKRAFEKYGIENFNFNVLVSCEMEELDNREVFYIAKYNTTDRNFGYNCESGGNLNKKLSAETCQKISNSRKGKKASIEARQKMSAVQKGRTASLETKQKISKIHKGKTVSIETRQKLSLSHKAENLSVETLQKMSNASKGRIPSIETRQKISNACKGRTLSNARIITHNGKSQTIKKWAEDIGIDRKTLEKRLTYGWTVERALTEKPKKGGN